MNQRLIRTLMFVAAAAVCLGGAVATSIATRPAKLDDSLLVGQEFYPEFRDPTKATALRVAAYDKDAAQVKVFNVEFRNGLWRIPSHHDYPADGEEQLAKTAASVVGIERGLYAGKTPQDHKRLGVLDPLDKSITGTEGRGSRITLYQGDKALIDLIIGNKVEDAENVYYVRKADDNRVYRAQLANLRVSTRFADWIEPDLLKLDRNKLVEIVVDRYHIDEQRGAVEQEEVNVLRKEASGTWQLEGIDAAKEKLKTATVNQMTYALDDLKIVGVRQKPPGLVAILKGEKGAGLSQLELVQMQRAGYFLTGRGELVSNEGEILAGTDEGVRYTLRFGEVVSGSDLEIEVGSPVEATADTGAPSEESGSATPRDADSDTADDAANGEDASGGRSADDATAAASGDDSKLKKNRYLFITATFDESLLGERPQPPVEPQPPAEPAAQPSATDAGGPVQTDAAAPQQAQPSAEQTSEDDAAAPVDDAKPDDAASGADAEAAANDGTDAAADGQQPEPAEQPDPQKAYEQAKQKYESDRAAYEASNAEYERKVEAGRKRAQELNERFAAWYYVISADLFDKLHVARSELVEPQTPPSDSQSSADSPATETTPSDSDSSPATETTPETEAAPETESTPGTSAPSSDPVDASRDDSGAAPDTGDGETGAEQETTDSPVPASSDSPDAAPTADNSQLEPATGDANDPISDR